MKKQKNKQGIKASKLAKAENKLKKQAEQMITVKNAEGEPDTQAKILIQNKVNYTPKVSVIIPVYNVEAYLRECLDSVINQTLKEIEIICVDDGSTDSSLEILKEYAKKDNRISILIQKNSGSGKSRNNGINNSKGEFIAFMDSDDFYPSRHTLENMYTKACKYNVNICGGSLNQLKEGKIITDPKLFEDGYTFVKEGIISYKDYQFDYGYWRFIYKRQFLRENQLYFPDYLRGQDPPFFIKAMATAQQFYALREATYVYRVSHKNIQWTERKAQDVAKGLMDCLNLAETQNYDELYFRLSKRVINPYISNIFKLFIEEDDTKRLLCRMINNLNYQKIYMINPNYQLPDLYQKFLETKKVSIIIPVYNTAPYLRECLDSVINQSLKEIEIICVNDGSTDNSLDILEEYAAKDKRIIIINQENQGLSCTRNNALKIAKGEYIQFLDSDDYIDLNTCADLYNKSIRFNLDMVNFEGINFDENKQEQLKGQTIFYISPNEEKTVYSGTDLEKIKEFIPISACRFFYKRKFIIDNKMLFPEHLCFEDNYFVLKALLLVKNYGVLRKIYYYRRIHKNSITQNWSKHFSDYIKIVLKIDELFKQYGSKQNFSKKRMKIYKENVIAKYNSFNQSDQEKYKKEILEFKQKMGLKEYSALKKELYKQELQTWYQRVTGKYLNLDNPCTFNEKIQWLKLYDSTPIKTRLADKYLVRDWVKEKIGEQYLIPLLGVYDKFEEIDFEKLPNQFVIKCNHGCAYNIIVRDKTKLDLAEVKEKLNKWMSENFAFKAGYELHYRDIKPKIIIEKYMENKGSQNLYDYKFWCFNSEVKYMQFRDDFSANLKMVFYDLNWKKQPFYYDHPLYDKELEKPDNFQDMINIAKKLCQGFAFVCVDMYRLNDGTIYFGEMTFTRSTGAAHWNNEKYNKTLGDMIKLPKMAYNINTGEYYKSPKRSKIKPYLLLPYNLCQKAYWNYKEKKIKKKNIQKQLFNSRIDIKNFGNENNVVQITTSAKVLKPAWFINAQGQGQVVESNKKIQNISIKAIQDGKLRLDFRGQDKRFEGVRFPVWIDYKSIKIDGKEILSAPIATWHDKPFRYEMPVKDGQIIEIEVIQAFHQYTKEELKDLILKLNPKSDYIQKNINKLISKIYNKIKAKPQERKSNKVRDGLFSIIKKDYSKEICLLGMKFKFKNKQKQLLYVLEKDRVEIMNLLKDTSAKISAQDKKIGELQKKIQNFEKTVADKFESEEKKIIGIEDNFMEQFEALNYTFKQELGNITVENERQIIDIVQSVKKLENDISGHINGVLNKLYALREKANELSVNLQNSVRELSCSLQRVELSVKYNLRENFEELRREFKENILSLDKVLNSTQISLQNDLSELKSIDFLTRHSFEKASLDTHQNILDKLRDVYEEVQNLNFAKVSDLKALASDLYLKLEDKNVADANNVAEILEKIIACKMDTQNAIKTLEEIQNKAIKNIEEVKFQQYKNYSELNFADLLHDSMQNRDWLKDKNFSLYLGAANYSFIYTLFRVLDNINPQNILEMGMGQTSKLTSQYVAYKNQKATLDIIENDANWIDIYQSQLPLNERVKVHLCNLEFFEFKGVENRKYRALDNVIKDKKYNLIIVDGPLGSRQLLPRSNIIDIVMSNLADDFIIIFDDAERKGEQETISQTKAKLTELGIEFTTQQRDALKSQFIIFSKSFNFARYL